MRLRTATPFSAKVRRAGLIMMWMDPALESVAALRGARSRIVVLDYLPIVVVRLSAVMSDEDIVAIFDAFEALFRAEVELVAIVDARSTTVAPSSRQRRDLMEWASRLAPLTARYGMGTSYVTTNAMVRAAVAAMSLVFENPTPTFYAQSLDEAVAFAAERLATRGIKLPPNVGELFALSPP